MHQYETIKQHLQHVQFPAGLGWPLKIKQSQTGLALGWEILGNVMMCRKNWQNLNYLIMAAILTFLTTSYEQPCNAREWKQNILWEDNV